MKFAAHGKDPEDSCREEAGLAACGPDPLQGPESETRSPHLYHTHTLGGVTHGTRDSSSGTSRTGRWAPAAMAPGHSEEDTEAAFSEGRNLGT